MRVRYSGRDFRQLPIASAILVIINVIVFLVCTFSGDLLYNRGMLDVSGVLVQGQYDRLLWAMFLHSDVNHIFNNMVILFFLGAMLEKEVGHIRLAAAYLLSGIGGNLLSLAVKAVTFESIGSVGASGAIFGLDGVLLALILFSGRRLPTATPVRVLLMIGLSLYSGYTTANVDNAGHVGGLLVGFLAGTGICLMDRGRKTRNGRRADREWHQESRE